MKILSIIALVCTLLLFTSCDKEIAEGVKKSDLSKDVELITDYGTIILRLSDETPIHRNNFIKLVNQHAYDSVSFHRVIEQFLVQTGDMATKPNYQNEAPYMIDAEIKPNLLHKRGALNAARLGDDQNPNRSSDGTQFTIIQGRKYTDAALDKTEDRINSWLAYNKVINLPEHKVEQEILSKLFDKMDSIYLQDTPQSRDAMRILNDSIQGIKSKLEVLAEKELETMERYHFPEEHREIYKTLGGAAHLDQNYTVFGEVMQGMEVVDSIASVATDQNDKPINDVRIISAKMIERKSYSVN